MNTNIIYIYIYTRILQLEGRSTSKGILRSTEALEAQPPCEERTRKCPPRQIPRSAGGGMSWVSRGFVEIKKHKKFTVYRGLRQELLAG